MTKRKTAKTANELMQDLDLYATYCRKYTIPAQNHGSAVALHNFVMFSNPRYRGPTFTWDAFTTISVQLARSTAWQGFSHSVWQKYGPLIQESAAHSAELTAEECLRHSDAREQEAKAAAQISTLTDARNQARNAACVLRTALLALTPLADDLLLQPLLDENNKLPEWLLGNKD